MAPATSGLLAGIPAHHLPGLAGGFAALVIFRLRLTSTRRAALSPLGWLLVFTGGVHIGLAFGHTTGQALPSWLFFVNGAAYLVLAVLRRDRRWWRPAAALLLLGTIVAYLVFVGSGREQPDPVGILDKLAELLALSLVMMPHERSPGGWRRPLRWMIASGASLGLTLATGTAIWAEDLAGSSHSHEVTSCTAGRHAGPGTVLRPAPCTVTPAQQAAAERLVAQTRESIAPYQDVRMALAAGYRPTTPDGDGVVHFGTAHPGRGSPLDPRHPAALVYVRTRHGAVLLGAMYQMPAQGQPGPDVGGALTPWHYHTNICFSLPGLFLSGLSTPFGQCPPWSIRVTSPDQLHVWTAPNPNGPFGDLDAAWARRLAQS